jgi:hypothetical protein
MPLRSFFIVHRPAQLLISVQSIHFLTRPHLLLGRAIPSLSFSTGDSLYLCARPVLFGAYAPAGSTGICQIRTTCANEHREHMMHPKQRGSA